MIYTDEIHEIKFSVAGNKEKVLLTTLENSSIINASTKQLPGILKMNFIKVCHVSFRLCTMNLLEARYAIQVTAVIGIALCPHIETDAKFKVQFADNHLGKIISYLTNSANNFKKVLIKKMPGAVTCCKICRDAATKMFPSHY